MNPFQKTKQVMCATCHKNKTVPANSPNVLLVCNDCRKAGKG